MLIANYIYIYIYIYIYSYSYIYSYKSISEKRQIGREKKKMATAASSFFFFFFFSMECMEKKGNCGSFRGLEIKQCGN